MSANRNLYEVLGVDRFSNDDEIKQAYRRLAARYHPDRNKDPSATATFQEIQDAYDVLSNPDRRKVYDNTGSSKEVTPDDIEAMNILMHTFNECINQGVPALHFLVTGRQALRAEQENVIRQRNAAYMDRTRLGDLKKMVFAKEGKRNLVHMLVDQRLKDVEKAIKDMDRREHIVVLASRMLDDHTVEEFVSLSSVFKMPT